MSGVFIKGMKMPSSCLKGGCPLDGASCDLWQDKYWSDWREPHRKRHPDCPLVPVETREDALKILADVQDKMRWIDERTCD